MNEENGTIKNPLTIIAKFAAIVEISGTLILPFIAENNQNIYVWFLIIFPTALVLIFFATLNFNYKVLYAPSDYKDENNFVRNLPKASATEVLEQRVKEELEENRARGTGNSGDFQNAKEAPSETNSSEGEFPDANKEQAPEPITDFKPETKVEPEPKREPSPEQQDAKANDFFSAFLKRQDEQTKIENYFREGINLVTENNVFSKLQKEFQSEIQRDILLSTDTGRFILDGIVEDRGVTTIIEVKQIKSFASLNSLNRTLNRLHRASKDLITKENQVVRIILALVVHEKSVDYETLNIWTDRLRENSSLPLDIRVYNTKQVI